MELVVYSAGWSEFRFDVWFCSKPSALQQNGTVPRMRTTNFGRPPEGLPILWNQKLFPSFKFDFTLSPTIHKERDTGEVCLKKTAAVDH
jgi:hypothetical protein